MNIHARKITTKPTMWERIERSPVLLALCVFIAFFGLLGCAEVLALGFEILAEAFK